MVRSRQERIDLCDREQGAEGRVRGVWRQRRWRDEQIRDAADGRGDELWEHVDSHELGHIEQVAEDGEHPAELLVDGLLVQVWEGLVPATAPPILWASKRAQEEAETLGVTPSGFAIGSSGSDPGPCEAGRC